MGRHAGFLTAASSLLRKTKSDGPHLIYIPEVSFSFDKLLSDIKKCYSKYGRVIVAVSEGIQDDKKKLISQTIKKKSEFDAHGNIQLSGTGSLGDYLSDKIKINLKLSRVRADTLGYPQRSFLGSTSEVDQREAYNIGNFAVKSSNKVNFSFSAGMKERVNLNNNYKIEFKINTLTDVAGKTKVMTKEYYDLKASNITKKFINYAYPLIGKKLIDTKSLI